MKYGKLTDGQLIVAHMPIQTPSGSLSTNDPVTLLSLGYKQLVFTPAPDPAGGALSFSWAEGEDTITQTWTVTPAADTEPDISDTTLDLLVDHEYRLCMLELGM